MSKPTAFINSHSEDEPVDVALVDEAHLRLHKESNHIEGKSVKRYYRQSTGDDRNV